MLAAATFEANLILGLCLLAVFAFLVVGYQRALVRQGELSRHQATHDSLTGLPNRALFADRVGQALAMSRRHGNGSGRGMRRTTDDVTLGAGTKALGATSNMILASVRQPANTASRPYASSPTLATIRSATSRWNISTMVSYQGGHGSALSQPVRRTVAML